MRLASRSHNYFPTHRCTNNNIDHDRPTYHNNEDNHNYETDNYNQNNN